MISEIMPNPLKPLANCQPEMSFPNEMPAWREIHMYIHSYVDRCICIYTQAHIGSCICVYTHMYIYAYRQGIYIDTVHTCVHRYTYKYTYV